MHKRLTLSLIATLVLSLWSSACFAADKDAKKKERKPLAVLHAALDKDYNQGMNNIRYKCTIWVRNVSGDDIDGIKCRLKVHEGSKLFYEKTQELDPIETGHRVFVVFKWEDFKDYEYTPEIFITYRNEEGKEVEFQAYAPTWEIGS